MQNKKPPFLFLRIAFPAIAWLVIAIGGCSYFKVSTSEYPRDRDIMAVLKPDRKFVFHKRNDVFVIDQLYIQNDSLIGVYGSEYVPYIKPGKVPRVVEPAPNEDAYRFKRKNGGRGILKEVHVFADTLYRAGGGGHEKIAIGIKDIKRFDVYSLDGTTTTLSWIVVGILSLPVIWAVGFGVLLLIGLITGSCPFIYSNTADGFRFEGEIYSGAVYASMERDDYLALPHLVAENGQYSIMMTNEVKEVHYTNLAELLVVDHPPSARVLADKYGNCHAELQSQKPFRATNLNGKDILAKISTCDSLIYAGDIEGDTIPRLDGAILSFVRPGNHASAKLFIRARNTQWLDYVYKNSHDLFGSYYDNWVKKQNKADRANANKWQLSQKIPLSVYIERNGKWEFCDYFNMAGPMAFRDDVLPISLDGLKGDSVKIMLQAGMLFWELDYAALDFSPNPPLTISVVSPETVTRGTEDNLSDLLKYSDLKYFIQEENSSPATLAYRVPPDGPGGRTVILHSRGYYNMLSETKGRPHFAKLKDIRKPGEFTNYSRELLMKIGSPGGSGN